MNKLLKLSICVLACSMYTGLLHAQYTVDVSKESNFAIQEHNNLGNLPNKPPVPHMAWISVLDAMANPDYFKGASSPFTFVIAHRGSHTAPGCAENAACAIAAAYQSGADAIELDIKITADGAPVLGHDVAVARELNNWVDHATGSTVTRTSAWTPFRYFSILDYTYQDLTRWPFLNRFAMPDEVGGDDGQGQQNPGGISDPNNPTRSTMYASDIQDSQVVDTYNKPVVGLAGQPGHQLTLFEALYLIYHYYPMGIFLDVKSYNDLGAVASTIRTIRDLDGLVPIALKIAWKDISVTNGNPNAYMNLDPGTIKYFFVFGTGDLQSMALAYDPSLKLPAPASTVTGDAYDEFKALCTAANGCLGAELSHKYPDSPTQTIFNNISDVKQYQIAGFQTVPQYSWYWETLPQKQQAVAYGKTFPRTDGSCCFALTDSLNISPSVGAEFQDLRSLYSWNESQFSTITTDEPLIVMRDLYAQGKRPSTVIAAVGGQNTNVPSGGYLQNVGPIRDGLYYIENANDQLAISAHGSGSNASLTGVTPTSLRQMWYVSSAYSSVYANTAVYTITNAAIDEGLSDDTKSGVSIAKGPPDSSEKFLWKIIPGGGTEYFFESPLTLRYLQESGGDVTTTAGENTLFTLVPVATPTSESSQQQIGPPGFTYCADDNPNTPESCSFAGPAWVAYGTPSSYRYIFNATGSVPCNQDAFDGVDPDPGALKACFYAPYDISGLYPDFGPGWSSTGGTFTLPATSVVAYGTTTSTGTNFTYATFPAGSHVCSDGGFPFNPSSLPGTCYTIPLSQTIVGPSAAGFTFCAFDAYNCPFTGTAAVAYGAAGSYTYKTFTNGVLCAASSFGLDPTPNVPKGCFYAPATYLTGPAKDGTLPTSFTFCSSQYSSCTVPSAADGGALVAFGAVYKGIPSFIYKPQTGTFDCDLPAFAPADNTDNDPAPGVVKTCYQSTQSTFVTRGPVGFTFCSMEGGTCQFSGVAQIAFGIDGHYDYIPTQQGGSPASPTGIACNVSSFSSAGGDPYIGHLKACYYRLY